MTTECPVCKGTGLIGAGPEPHLHQGDVVTCPNCKGTGQIEDGVLATEAVVPTPVEEAPAVETQTPSSEEIVPTEVVASIEEPTTPPTDNDHVTPGTEQFNAGDSNTPVDNVETPVVEEGVTLEGALEEAQ
jgi:hypothetical protein